MRDFADLLKDQTLERCAPCPSQSEIAEMGLHSGLPEGFSMEWVLDRYTPTSSRNTGLGL